MLDTKGSSLNNVITSNKGSMQLVGIKSYLDSSMRSLPLSPSTHTQIATDLQNMGMFHIPTSIPDRHVSYLDDRGS